MNNIAKKLNSNLLKTPKLNENEFSFCNKKRLFIPPADGLFVVTGYDGAEIFSSYNSVLENSPYGYVVAMFQSSYPQEDGYFDLVVDTDATNATLNILNLDNSGTWDHTVQLASTSISGKTDLSQFIVYERLTYPYISGLVTIPVNDWTGTFLNGWASWPAWPEIDTYDLSGKQGNTINVSVSIPNSNGFSIKLYKPLVSNPMTSDDVSLVTSANSSNDTANASFTYDGGWSYENVILCLHAPGAYFASRTINWS